MQGARKGIITMIALLVVAVCVGWWSVASGTSAPSLAPTTPPPPDTSPFPTATSLVASVAPTSTPTTTSRVIPLRRSDVDTAGGDDEQMLYRLVEEREVLGDLIADHLGEDEMMCVQHFDLSPTQCICFMGPLENAGIRGGGILGMRRIVILSGSAEEAALALIEDWSADMTNARGRDPCTTDHLAVSYDGGVFKPAPTDVLHDFIHTPIASTTALCPDGGILLEAPVMVGVSNWQTYEDQERGFQFRYPDGWRIEVFDSWVGVGPEEMGEDVQWGVRFFDNSGTTVEQVISDIGCQFWPDRTEVRECVYFDSIAAIKVIVTTSQIEDWYSESVVFEYEGIIFEIGNGAVRDDRFEAFYTSFHLER